MTVITLPRLPNVSRLMAKSLLSGFGRPGPEEGLPSRSVEVSSHRQDRARLTDYCRVTGFRIRDQVPATWLHVLTFPLHVQLMGQKDFPFPLAGTVHVSNEMTLHRPVSASEVLGIHVGTANMSPHKRGVTFDLVGRISVGDEVVWTGISTYMAMGRSLPGDPVRSVPRLTAPTGPPSQFWRLPGDLGRRYAKVSGDSNPIHLHKLTALPFGFTRPIIHGMWTHAKAMSSLGPKLPEAHTVQVAFTRPIPLPGMVDFTVDDEGEGIRFGINRRERTCMVGQVDKIQ